MNRPAAVAIVGAGASGTLTAAHLARSAACAGRALDVLLIDPQRVGTGLAYSTSDPRHRLNVPATCMSAWPDDPDHFVRWLHRHVSCDFPADGFAPRLHYAQYLASVLNEALADASAVRVEHARHRATDVSQVGRRLRVSLADGTSRAADAVVLALGHGSPSVSWAPPELRKAAQFVADPWRAQAELPLTRGDEIILVGAGLTAVDVAVRWAQERVRVHVVSRHGMLPLPHATASRPPTATPTGPLPTTLAEARRFVFDAIKAAGGDWRRAIDGLRPITGDLWLALGPDDRAAFLRTAARRWDRVRHRVDPAMYQWLEQRHVEGLVQTHAASVTDAEPRGRTVRVTLSDGSVIDAAAVLNCTGTCTGISASSDPLIMNLLSAGFAQAGPLDLGFATDGEGRIVSSSGRRPAAWTIGPLRRGELWESTAVPEIRVQAATLARRMLDTLPGPQLRRRPRDPYGLPLTTSHSVGATYAAALGRILRGQSGAEKLLSAAVRRDPDFALGHAALALLGVEWGLDVDVDSALAAAGAAGVRADERERRFIDVATARVREPGAASAAALLAYIQAYPEDALAVSIAVPTIAFGGATEMPAEAWALVEGLGGAYGDDWWYLGLLAFVRQEQGRFDEAWDLAARALSIEPAAGHAAHAKAHVHYETGDHRAGLAWLDRWIATRGATASHRAHFSWHAALHELALGDDRAVARRYADQLAPPTVTGVRALVDSASLLWRARMVGAAVPAGIAAVLEAVPLELLTQPPTPFAALHTAIALAAAGDCRALVQLRWYAESQPDGPFPATVAPLADALCDLVHGDVSRAADGLLALPDVDKLGGSAAQRDVVEDTLLHCAIAAGRTELARRILAQRLDRRDSQRDRHRYAALPLRDDDVRTRGR